MKKATVRSKRNIRSGKTQKKLSIKNRRNGGKKLSTSKKNRRNRKFRNKSRRNRGGDEEKTYNKDYDPKTIENCKHEYIPFKINLNNYLKNGEVTDEEITETKKKLIKNGELVEYYGKDNHGNNVLYHFAIIKLPKDGKKVYQGLTNTNETADDDIKYVEGENDQYYIKSIPAIQNGYPLKLKPNCIAEVKTVSKRKNPWSKPEDIKVPIPLDENGEEQIGTSKSSIGRALKMVSSREGREKMKDTMRNKDKRQQKFEKAKDIAKSTAKSIGDTAKSMGDTAKSSAKSMAYGNSTSRNTAHINQMNSIMGLF